MLTPALQVDSRIIIDTYAYNRFNPNRSISLSPLGNKDQASDSSSEDGYYTDDDVQLGTQQPRVPLTKNQLLIASPSVRGYALKTKKWRKSALCAISSSSSNFSLVEFFIASVREIEWSDGAFQSLVLPADQKELVLAFAESQAKYKGTFDDVIQGKGQIIDQVRRLASAYD